MTNILWLLFELGINVLQGFLAAYFVCGSLKHKQNKRIISYSLCTIIIFISLTITNYFSYYEGAAIFINSVLLFLFSHIMLEGTIPQKIFVSIVPVNGMAVCSIFSTNLISFIVNQPIYEFLSKSTTLRLITVLVANIVLFLILYIIKKVTARTTLKLMAAEWLLLSFDLVLSVVAYMFLYYAIYSSQSIRANFFNALCAVAIIIINITMYVLLANFSNRYQIQLENNLLRQQAEYQAETILETKKQYDELQKVRHDFKNVLGVIDHLNSSHNNEEISEYISEYLKLQNKSIHVIHTGSSFVDAIINAKLAEANGFGVEVQISTVCDIGNENSMDLCTLLGNLFDNAIRAAKDSKRKTIKLDIRREMQTTIISMKNAIDSSILAVNPHLLSDKPDAGNHGYGTKIIKDIAAKHQGYVDFYEENGFFCCNVIL